MDNKIIRKKLERDRKKNKEKGIVFSYIYIVNLRFVMYIITNFPLINRLG